MGSERQCGLGSLLPMSCRGRAEAFARRLHTRLRSLGAEPGGAASEASWLHNQPNHPPTNHHPDSDVFYDFDLEPESPSSPVDDIPENELQTAPKTQPPDPESGIFSSPVDNVSPPSNSDSDAAYYDLETESETFKSHLTLKEASKTKPNLSKLKLSTPASEIIDQLFQNKAISPERQSPIKTQPLARENGYADYGSLDKRDSQTTLYAPINFEHCQKRNSVDRFSPEREDADEVDSAPPDAYLNGRISPEKTLIQKIEETEPHIKAELEKLKIDDTPQAAEDDANNNQNGDDDQNDSSDDRPQRVRRCSSLRTGKTPPGTPGRKKIVRFADVLGLDLADVKTFMDDIPNVPKSAYEDLRDADLSSLSIESIGSSEVSRTLDKSLVAMFQQPGDQPTFLDILNTRSVCLENAVVQEGASVAIYGTVRVRNLDFHKSVQIRYSLDGWKTFSDLSATYVPNSCDGFSDRFQFLLYAHTVTAGQKLEFAARFMCKGCQFWDNNLGANYCFQCVSSKNNAIAGTFYNPTTISPVDNWQASFY